MRTTAILSVMALAFLFTPALFAQDKAKPAEGKAQPVEGKAKPDAEKGDAEKGDAEKAEGVQWKQDLTKAMEMAKSDKKRLFVEFTAEW